MSIEPSIAGLIAGPNVLTDWSAYRACPICRAAIGKPCQAMFTRIESGQPVGPPRLLQVAHGHRRRRTGR